MTTAPKFQRGDLLLVRTASFTGVKPGLFIVLETGPGGLSVMPALAESVQGTNVNIQEADVVLRIPTQLLHLDRLPAGLVDVSQAPAPAPKPAAPAPELPMKYALVSVPNAGRPPIEMVRFKTPTRPAEIVHMETFETGHRNRYSSPERPSRLAVWVPEDLLKPLLANENGLYVIEDPKALGHLPAPEEKTFVKEGAYQR